MPTRALILLIALAPCEPLWGQATVGTVVVGQVLDAGTGLPMARVKISLDRAVTATDSEGRYSLSAPNQGEEMRAEYPGYYPERIGLEAGCEDTAEREVRCELERDLRLRPLPDLSVPSRSTCTLIGTLRSPIGSERLSNATIRAEADLWVLSDSLSAYRLEEVPAGLYWVEASLIGMQRTTRLVFAECSEARPTVELDFVLYPLTFRLEIPRRPGQG